MTILDLLMLIFSLSIFPSTTAQFGFFDQMFGNQGGQGSTHQQSQQNVRSDSVWYQQQYDAAPCDKYLCPGTLSCVHFPHHCPCAFPANEDKIELGEGIAICASKGGWKAGEVARKVELARKGLL